jgi:ferrous iron transport protein B
MTDSTWAFLRRAGTLILASMLLVWAVLYFPYWGKDVQNYDLRIAELRSEVRAETDENLKALKQEKINNLYGEWKRGSWLGMAGHALEPVVRPLGWDWRIGMAAVASFPAREVVVGTLGIIYNLGEGDPEEVQKSLGDKLQEATQEDGRKVFTVPVALSLMVFFALCCQCVSTLAVMRRETHSWRWPAFTFAYMTVLAYLGALAVYQVGSWIS